MASFLFISGQPPVSDRSPHKIFSYGFAAPWCNSRGGAICGGSSAGRASDFQSEGRGFETRPPLHAPLGRRVVVFLTFIKAPAGGKSLERMKSPDGGRKCPPQYGDVTERQCKIRLRAVRWNISRSETTVRGSSPRRLHKSAPCGVGGAIQVKETAARSPAMAQTRRGFASVAQMVRASRNFTPLNVAGSSPAGCTNSAWTPRVDSVLAEQPSGRCEVLK